MTDYILRVVAGFLVDGFIFGAIPFLAYILGRYHGWRKAEKVYDWLP